MMFEAIETICNRLSERTSTLFIGNGLNRSAKNAQNDVFPFGDSLSSLICEYIGQDSAINLPLEQIIPLARYQVGEAEFNRFLYEKLSGFKPTPAHHKLLQLPWDVIFTENYDLLLEQAYANLKDDAAGKLSPILSRETNLDAFAENDILYYKLKGSLDYANTPEGKLVLTQEDNGLYEHFKRPLIKRLGRKLLDRCFLFIGYSLSGNSLISIIEDCRRELEISAFPPCFVILESFTDIQAKFWKDRYNVRFIQADTVEFIDSLLETWTAQNRSVIPFQERQLKEYVQVDESTRFTRVGDSYYLVRSEDCVGRSQPQEFFLGAPPSWTLVHEKVAPPRDAYWTLLETLFPELTTPDLPISIYLITGSAGTGKTTLLYSIAHTLAQDFSLPVVVHILGTPLDVGPLNQFIDKDNLSRVILLVDNAGEKISQIERFFEEATAKKIPVTLILAERTNQWKVGFSASRRKLNTIDFELGALSTQEIESILDALQKFDCLGKLKGSSREYQIQHFSGLAHKELLVALRELTSQTSFDRIIKDEFEKIPSDTAKKAYVYVSALGQFDLSIRYENLVSLLELRYDELRTQVFFPTEGVLISAEETGRSRHNHGFRLSARHPIIASVIFAEAAPDDETKFKILNSLLAQLDPGYSEDKRLLEAIVRKRQIVNIFAQEEKKRAIYERLESILPGNQFVFQHRSILERELENAEASIKYARRATSIDGRNPIILNTLGFALEYAARDEDDPMKRRMMLLEAVKIFDEQIRSSPSNPFGYLGKAYIEKQELIREDNREKKLLLQADLVSLLEEAYESTQQSDVIAGELATQKKYEEDIDAAIEVLVNAIKKDPTNTRLRDLWVRLLDQKGDFKKALNVAMDGQKHDPTSWRIQRHIARMQYKLGGSIDAIKGHYEAAIRHNKSDINLLVELAYFLFINGQYSEADKLFAEAKNLSISIRDKRNIRQWWKNDRGEKRQFKGRIRGICGAIGIVLSIPENFEATFWRNNPAISDVIEEDKLVSFYIGFNAFGPSAEEIRPIDL